MGPTSGKAPALGARVHAAMRLRHLSPRTEEAYLGWMRRYFRFHGRRDPSELGAEHVTGFLKVLATHERISASTQNQALAALLFLYRDVLGRDLPWMNDLIGPSRPSSSRSCFRERKSVRFSPALRVCRA